MAKILGIWLLSSLLWLCHILHLLLFTQTMASDLSNSYSTPITNRDGQQRVNSGASASFHSAAATQSGPTSNKSNIHIPMTTTPSSTSSSHHSTYVDSVTSNPNSSFNQYSNSHSHSRSGDGNPILKRSNLLSQPTINDSPSVNANINKQNRRVNNERSIHRFGNKAKVRSASGNSSGSGSGSSDREKEESNIQLKEAKENLNRNDEAENGEWMNGWLSMEKVESVKGGQRFAKA